jgi:hypothetical protein
VLRFALLAALVLAPSALADGPGVSPGVDFGGDGVVAASGLVRYTTLSGPRSTMLEAIRMHDGHVLRWRPIPGAFGIPLVTYNGTPGGIARDGRLLVLAEPGYAPPPAVVTTFQLVDPHTFGYETISLKGSFAFDALSPDARRLYLIQHVSATNLTRYVVREYDVSTGRLLPQAIADRTQRGWVMQGSPLARTVSANGRFVYTLYQNPGGYPFVHALDTMRGVAHCIGLPWSGDQSIFSTMKLSLDDHGGTLALSVPWSGREHPATLPSFRIDTESYRLLPAPKPHHFPWWTLSLAPLPLLLLAAASRRARVTSTMASRSATAMFSSGVWISAIPFARLTHWRPRSLKTFASAAPPERL